MPIEPDFEIKTVRKTLLIIREVDCMNEEGNGKKKMCVSLMIIFGMVIASMPFMVNIVEGQPPFYNIEQDSLGNYHKAFIDNITGNNEIYYTNDIGGQFPQDWNPPTKITNTTNESLLLDLGIYLSTDTIFIIWEEIFQNGNISSSYNSTYYTISRNYGIDWTEPKRSYEDILLKYAGFDPLNESPKLPPYQEYLTTGYEYYLVQTKTPIIQEWFDGIEDAGGESFNYIPENAYIVRMSPTDKQNITNIPFIRWIGILHPMYKLSNDLYEIVDQGGYHQNITIDILVFDNIDFVINEIVALNGTIESASEPYIRAVIEETKLYDVAMIPDVNWIENIPTLKFFNDLAVQNPQMDVVLTWNNPTNGLTGTGQTIAVMDTGIDTGIDEPIVGDIHQDFENRVTIIDYSGDGADDRSGHGTHVAGSVMGNGAASGGLVRGVAFDSNLVFQAIGNDNGQLVDFTAAQLNTRFQAAYTEGARVHTNSWGASSDGRDYNIISQTVDQFMWDNLINNDDMVILFSAGNDGNDIDGDGVVDNPSIGIPGNAKNCITVGAVENNRPNLNNQVDNDQNGLINDELFGDMDGDGWPGLQGVDEDVGGGVDFEDVEVREALEVLLDVDTDLDVNDVEDLLRFRWVVIPDGRNNDWDFYVDIDLSGTYTAGDEKYMDEDIPLPSGTLTAPDHRLWDGGDGTWDALPGAFLIPLIDETEAEDSFGGPAWSQGDEEYRVNRDHDEDGITPWAEMSTPPDNTRLYNDPEVASLIPFLATRNGIPYQACDDDEDGLIDEDPIDTYGDSWSPNTFPQNPINEDILADNSQGMAAFSSRGPVELGNYNFWDDDRRTRVHHGYWGRLKPDVVAPGTWILSTRSSQGDIIGGGAGLPAPPYDPNSYQYMSGTSMATPLTAGAVALIRQYYTDLHDITPSAALLKATLINGANDIRGQYVPDETGPIPNIHEGWGSVAVTNTLFPDYPITRRFVDETDGFANTGDPPDEYWIDGDTYPHYVHGNPLKITLVWTDPPGNPTARKMLVNNLNLRVSYIEFEGQPNERTIYYVGNNFYPFSSESRPTQPASVSYYGDHHDNVECVFLEPPIPFGRFKIEVIPEFIDPANSPQPYALVMSYGQNSIEIDLHEGGNFISLPLDPDRPHVEEVLRSIDGQYSLVRYYDASIDEWRQYDPGKPFGNDLWYLYADMGFWVYVDADCTLSLYGAHFTENHQIDLYTGWNDAGYPALRDWLCTAQLNPLTYPGDIQIIMWYETPTTTWYVLDPSESFVRGKGYSIHYSGSQGSPFNWIVPHNPGP
jgi:subtilisin family serine protease